MRRLWLLYRILGIVTGSLFFYIAALGPPNLAEFFFIIAGVSFLVSVVTQEVSGPDFAEKYSESISDPEEFERGAIGGFLVIAIGIVLVLISLDTSFIGAILVASGAIIVFVATLFIWEKDFRKHLLSLFRYIVAVQIGTTLVAMITGKSVWVGEPLYYFSLTSIILVWLNGKVTPFTRIYTVSLLIVIIWLSFVEFDVRFLSWVNPKGHDFWDALTILWVLSGLAILPILEKSLLLIFHQLVSRKVAI